VIYAACVALGAMLALVAVRLVPSDDATPPELARKVRIAAVVGAIVGAYLFELPADVMGWAPRGLAEPGTGHAVLGRTVLGGILGGWLAVELAKWRLGHRGATGDRFALPLAIALTFGRIGCTLTGCCPGVPLDPGSPWAPLSIVHHDPARFPATLIESWFHALAAAAIVIAMRLEAARGRRLSIYVAIYAAVRFALEELRDDPEVLFGLSYYQLLTLPLFALALGTTLARSRAPSTARTATTPA
jgi:phosphatidylglycerol---prolipoprotein diacylglyceryl transferase